METMVKLCYVEFTVDRIPVTPIAYSLWVTPTTSG